MNEDLHYIPEAPDPQLDQSIDKYFENAQLQEVDTSDLMMMTHMKILQDGLKHSLRRWKMISLGSIAACAAVMLTIGLTLFPSDSHKMPDDTFAKIEEKDYNYNELIVPVGQRRTLMLPDGTKLIANSRSQVRYPAQFVGDTRTIWASGEIYLDVAKDALKPFIVDAGGFSVKVHGTKFAVSTYSQSNASVVLVEGSVAVCTDSDDHIRMLPGHQLTIREGAIDEIKRVDAAARTSWIDGFIILDAQTLGDILPRLGKYYNVNFDTAPELKDMKLYGSLDLKDDIDGVMRVLSSIIPMSVEESPDKATFRLSAMKN